MSNDPYEGKYQSLDKETLGRWIERLWADDYNRSFLMNTPVNVEWAVLLDQKTVEAQFQFWDDEHHITDDQSCFMFDINIGNEYGENFPAHLVDVTMRVKYRWPTPEDRLNLTLDLEDEELIEQDIFVTEWDSPKITNELVQHFISGIKPKFMRAMLVEKYDAVNGLPPSIPERLVPSFERIVTG